MADQNSKYRAAVGRRNRGSDPSPRTTKNALDTAIGRNKRSSVTNTSVPPTSGNSTATSAKGSLEGYMHAPAAPIQINGTGYLSEASHRARANPSMPKDLTRGINSPTLLQRSNPGRVHDMRTTGSSWNSASILKRHLELNDMFKG